MVMKRPKKIEQFGPLFHVFRVQKSKKRGITAVFDPLPPSTPKNEVYDLKIEPDTHVWS